MSARKLSRLAGLVLAIAVVLGGASVATASHTHATAAADHTDDISEWQ